MEKNKDGFEPGQDLTFEQLLAMRGQVERPDPITREDIAKMPKADVIEHLTAHGIEAPEGKLDDLRAQLAAIMFVEA